MHQFSFSLGSGLLINDPALQWRWLRSKCAHLMQSCWPLFPIFLRLILPHIGWAHKLSLPIHLEYRVPWMDAVDVNLFFFFPFFSFFSKYFPSIFIFLSHFYFSFISYLLLLMLPFHGMVGQQWRARGYSGAASMASGSCSTVRALI